MPCATEKRCCMPTASKDPWDWLQKQLGFPYLATRVVSIRTVLTGVVVMVVGRSVRKVRKLVMGSCQPPLELR